MRPIVCQLGQVGPCFSPEKGQTSIVPRWCGTVASWTVSIDGVQHQERPPCIEQVGKVFLQAMGPGQGLGFPLVDIGRKGLGIDLHICSFGCLGLLEIHLETLSGRLFWRFARGDSAGSMLASLAPASGA